MIPISIQSIQSVLHIPETGILDEFTEAAIRNFQLRNSLIPTGIVDADTAALLFPNDDSELIVPPNDTITTDLREMHTEVDRFKVNIKKLPRFTIVNGKKMANYLTPSRKQYICLHHTAGWENPYAVVNDWANDTRGPVATQFIIGGPNCQTTSTKYDGEIVQCMDYDDYGWHNGLGQNPLQINSVGIELCNFGYVEKTNSGYITWVKKSIDKSQVVDLGTEWRHKRYFHKYSDAQINALQQLLEKIGKDLGIDIRSGIRERLQKLSKFDAFDFSPAIKSGKVRGVFTHANVSGPNKFGNYEKWDLFPQDELCDMFLSL